MRASREEKKERAIGPPNGKRRESSIRPPRSPFLSTSPGKRGEHGVESLSGERTVQEGTEDAREWALQKLHFVSVAATANIVFELSCFALRRPPCLRRATRSKTGPHQGRRGGHEGSEEERDEKGGPHFFALSPLFFLGGGRVERGKRPRERGERARVNSFVVDDFSEPLLTLPSSTFSSPPPPPLNSPFPFSSSRSTRTLRQWPASRQQRSRCSPRSCSWAHPCRCVCLCCVFRGSLRADEPFFSRARLNVVRQQTDFLFPLASRLCIRHRTSFFSFPIPLSRDLANALRAKGSG